VRGGAAALALDRDPLLWAAASGAIGWLLALGFVPEIERAPVQGLPERQSSIRRLAEGIALRAERLREQRAVSHAGPALLDEIAQLAGQAVEVGDRVFADSVLLPSPTTPPHDAREPDPSAVAAVERLTSQLLSIASALDDALAIGEVRSPPPETTAAMLRSLQENIAVARTTLPEVRVLRGK
jgi:hypothetical protein